jgi:cobyrinic acid a,c-diamide synthase
MSDSANVEPRRIPRLVIAGEASGVGKTTTVVALIAALRTRKLKVAAFKCGPDYLDPTYHSRAAGSTSHNLDGWMMERETVLATFARASQGADIAIIEGVMGLFDGASPVSEEGSTAQIAKWLDAPVVLVVDTSGMARTVAAVAKGFTDFDPAVRMQGVTCNRVGSRGHLDLLRSAIPESCVGGLPAKPQIAFSERHLGLCAATHDILSDDMLSQWSATAAEWLDVDKLIALAQAAAPIKCAALAVPTQTSPRCRIAVAFDSAFHFYYEDNLARLQAAGATLIKFSPISDAKLPETDGLYIGGGYPELHAEKLSANPSMLKSIRAFAASGGPVYGECGGLMYLSAAIRTLDGTSRPMLGLLPLETIMSDRLQSLGYVEVVTRAQSLIGPAGTRFRGHQFRYSEPRLLEQEQNYAYALRSRYGGDETVEGYSHDSVLGSYVHAHWASNPAIPAHFVSACVHYRSGKR